MDHQTNFAVRRQADQDVGHRRSSDQWPQHSTLQLSMEYLVVTVIALNGRIEPFFFDWIGKEIGGSHSTNCLFRTS